MKVFVYVVAASKDPNNVECVVPFEVNDDLIFEPCKKTLERKLLRMVFEKFP